MGNEPAKLVWRALLWAVGLLIVSSSVLSMILGTLGAIGVVLGFAVSAFGVVTIWMVARFAAEGRKAGVLAVLFLMLKLPLIVAGTFWATSLGSEAVSGFAIGMGCVYLPLVLRGYLMAQREA